MAVMMAETALGTALEVWMRRQRLTVQQVAALAGVTRRTVYNVQESGRAEVETIWKLARGLATDPYTREIDTLVYADAFPDLLAAAGYPREIAQIIRVDLEDEITQRVRDTDKARALLRFLNRYHTLPLAQRDVFDRLIAFKLDE